MLPDVFDAMVMAVAMAMAMAMVVSRMMMKLLSGSNFLYEIWYEWISLKLCMTCIPEWISLKLCKSCIPKLISLKSENS